MDYYLKYLKYKHKYLDLKNMVGKGLEEENVKEENVKEENVEEENVKEEKVEDIEADDNILYYDDFIYRLSEYNEDLYDIEQYTKKPYVYLSDINLSLIDEYLDVNQECSKKFMEYIKYLYSNTIRINHKQIIEQINFNVNELLTHETYSQMVHILCVPTSNNSMIDKSCFFYILYFIYVYRINSGSYPFIYNKENLGQLRYYDIIIESTKNNNALFIFCDDILYSGTQMTVDIISSNIIKNPDELNKEELAQEDLKHINIYLNIVGYTETSLVTLQNRIRKVKIIANNLEDENNKNIKKIIIPSNLKPYNNSIKNITLEFIKSKNITLKDFYVEYGLYYVTPNNIIKSEIQNMLSTFLDTNLLYPFYKYPDGVSLYENLCKIFIFDNDDKIIDVPKIIKENKFNFKEIPYKNIEIIDHNIYFIEQITDFLNAQYEKNKDLIEPNYLLQCKKLSRKLNRGINLVINSDLLKSIKNPLDPLDPLGSLVRCEKMSDPFYKKLKYKYGDKILDNIYKIEKYNRQVELKNSFSSIYQQLFN
jgi:hypothetical protein